MKKTVNVNIAGFVFHIEEEAYLILQGYLTAIEKKFKNDSERQEIMRDIESRIAELFQLRNNATKEVITELDVAEIMLIMGQPEDYVGDEFEAGDSTDNQAQDEDEMEYDADAHKRLFRDKDNAQIGGVCSGLAAYFGMDPVVIRIIFVVMFLLGLSGVVIYLILLFVIPEAKTNTDKLKMRGKPININSIKETASDIKSSFENGVKKKNFGRTLNKAVVKGVQSSSKFIRAFSKVVGVGFLFGGVFAFLVLVGVFIGDGGLIPFWGERQFLNLREGMDMLYASSFLSSLTYFSIILVLFIPILGMIYTGVKLLFDLKTNIKYFRTSLMVLWIISLCAVSFTGVLLGLEFRDEATVTSQVEIAPELDELKIEVLDDDIFSNNIDRTSSHDITDMIDIQDERVYLGYPKLIIVESPSDSVYKVEIHKSSRGINEKEAIMNAELMSYNCSFENGVLQVSPYMNILMENKFRGQQLEILVRVPKGKTVLLGKNIERVLQPISEENKSHTQRQIYSNTVWKNDNSKMVFVDVR